MEISHSLSCKLLHKNLYCSGPILPSRVPSIPLSLIPSSKSFSKLVAFRSAVRRQRGTIGPSYASGIRASSADDGERWILEPVMEIQGTYTLVVFIIICLPGVATVAPPGSRIVFSDIHLATFLVLKLNDVKHPMDVDESPEQPEAGSSTKTIDAVTDTGKLHTAISHS